MIASIITCKLLNQLISFSRQVMCVACNVDYHMVNFEGFIFCKSENFV